MPRFEKLMGAESVNVVISSGGKIALTNHPFADTQLPAAFRSWWDALRALANSHRLRSFVKI
ncbi:MAG: hypothetical protein AUI02_03030 [Acidobacteria bacterium 13_2_20CM_2_57_12]|nr:MAG: hypothetical protein AUI02_03030 [Acidobacteria bacterium 13_2_20CM_2_57_12]